MICLSSKRLTNNFSTAVDRSPVVVIWSCFTDQTKLHQNPGTKIYATRIPQLFQWVSPSVDIYTHIQQFTSLHKVLVGCMTTDIVLMTNHPFRPTEVSQCYYCNW